MSATGKKKSVSSAFQFFQVARYVSLLAASILITKSSIRQDYIGHYETYLLIASTLSFFWINGILTSYLRIYSTAENKNAVVFNTFIILLLVSFSISLFLVLFRSRVNSYFGLGDTGNAYFIFVVFFLFNSVSFFGEYILLSKQQYTALIILGVAYLILQTVLIAAPVYFIHDYKEIIIGLFVFTGLKFLYTGWLVMKNGHFKINRPILKNYRLTTPPLIVSYFLGGMSIYVDGIIVTHYFDKSTFAVYQYGAREFPLSLLLANAFSASVIQVIASNLKEGLQEVKQGSGRLMHILFPICILLILSSKWLFPVVFNPQFSESYIYFNIYLLLVIPRLLFPQSIATALSATRIILISSSIEFVLNIVLSLLLLYLVGLPGVAIATVIAFLTDKTILAVYLQNKMHIKMEEYTPLKTYFSYSFILILAFLFIFIFM